MGEVVGEEVEVEEEVMCRCSNGHGRWSKATALFWCQNVYRELSQFHSQGTSHTRGVT